MQAVTLRVKEHGLDRAAMLIYEASSIVSLQHVVACRHVETILCSRLRRGPVLDPYKRRIMKMPDGGSVALDFEDLDSSQDLPSDAPVVILLPGGYSAGWSVAAARLPRHCFNDIPTCKRCRNMATSKEVCVYEDVPGLTSAICAPYKHWCPFRVCCNPACTH